MSDRIAAYEYAISKIESDFQALKKQYSTDVAYPYAIMYGVLKATMGLVASAENIQQVREYLTNAGFVE